MIASISQAILDSITYPLLITDKGGVILFANQELYRVTSFTSSEVISQPFSHFIIEKSGGSPFPDRYLNHPMRGAIRRKTGVSVQTKIGVREMILEEGVFYTVSFQDITEQVLLEEALRDSETKLDVITEHATDAIYIKDRESRYILINRQGAEMIGASVEAVLGKTDLEVLEDELGSQIRQADKIVFETQQPYSYEVVRVIGKERHIFSTTKIPFTSQHQIVGLIGITHDITQQKQNEMLLIENEVYYRLLAENVTDLISRHSIDGRYMYVSPVCRALIGYEVDEMNGHSIYEFIHPHYLDVLKNAVASSLRDTESYTVTYRIRHKDGHYIWFETTCKAVREPETGKAQDIIFVSRDVTDRMETEIAFQESEERFRLLVESVEEYAIYMLNPEGEIVSWNAGIERINGYKADEILGQHFSIFYSPEQSKAGKPQSDMHTALTEGRCETEGWHPRKDGSHFYANTILAAIRDAIGNVTGFSRIVRDMTARKIAEEELHKREELYRTLARHLPNMMVFLYDQDLRYLVVEGDNKLANFGLSREIMEGKTLFDNLLAPETVQRLAPYYLRSLQGERVTFEGRFLDWDYLITALPVRNAQGEIFAGMMVSEDITERKRIETAEREQRALAEALQETAAALTSSLKLDDVLDRIMSNLQRVLPHHGVYIMLVDGEPSREQVSIVRAYESNRSPLPPGVIGLKFHLQDVYIYKTMFETHQPLIVAHAGEYEQWVDLLEWRPVAYIGTPIIVDEEVLGFINVHNNEPGYFNETHVPRLQAFANQAALAIQNAQLYQHAQEIATIEERQRLARDLHDSVTQTIFSASVMAETITRLLKPEHTEFKDLLMELHRLTRAALSEMRMLLMELRPSALLNADLGDLLSHVLESLRGQTRTQFSLTLEGSVKPPPDVHLAFYRIAQEALNNITKHARANEVHVFVRRSEKGIELRIIDDGVGFDPDTIPTGHFGLGIMRERVQSVNGTLEVNSHPGDGTEIRVSWKP